MIVIVTESELPPSRPGLIPAVIFSAQVAGGTISPGWVKTTITQTELRVLLFMDSPEDCGCLAEIHMTGHLCVMSDIIPFSIFIC